MRQARERERKGAEQDSRLENDRCVYPSVESLVVIFSLHKSSLVEDQFAI